MAIPKSRLPVTIHPIIKVVKEATTRHVKAFAKWRFGFTVIFKNLNSKNNLSKQTKAFLVKSSGL